MVHVELFFAFLKIYSNILTIVISDWITITCLIVQLFLADRVFLVPFTSPKRYYFSYNTRNGQNVINQMVSKWKQLQKLVWTNLIFTGVWKLIF